MAEDLRKDVNGSLSPHSDGEYEPSADAMVHDCDDEGTLEEEEMMSNESADNNELDDLQKEGDMPLEALLAMYGYGSSFMESDSHQDSLGSTSEEEILNKQDLTLDKDEVARDILHDNDDSETSLEDLIESVHPSSSLHLLRSFNTTHNSHLSHDYEDENDEDYVPALDDESWKKNIQVGDDYQVKVPDMMNEDKADDRVVSHRFNIQEAHSFGFANTGPNTSDPVAERGDLGQLFFRKDVDSMAQLLWSPENMEEDQVMKYLSDVQSLLTQGGDDSPVPDPGLYRDNEQALYTLLYSEFNTERALTYGKLQPPCPDPSSKDPMRLWSEEECESFESGLRIYGKNFFSIQLNKLPDRSVGELVQFYYFWKKTERREAFTNRGRHEKKYPIKPGQTDYISRFGEPLENAADDPELSPLRPASDCECHPPNGLIQPHSPNQTNERAETIGEPMNLKRACPFPDETGERPSNNLDEKRMKVDTLSPYNNGHIVAEVSN